ncbi:disease resistance protein RGA2-like [Triticum urartu]|uniref:disease resistance protein RGA2-like n=1 Tax=Triticum urartu TaxID=4572 RepID=UPI002043DBF5|nr:disease resistance protein RGA2-like [Triticum urartu]
MARSDEEKGSVINGFFREEETSDGLHYVMHDLLHDLALKVASHDCLSLHFSDVGPVDIQPSTHHLSIRTENLGEYNAVSSQNIKSELEKLKTSLKVEHLQTLMLFGEMDKGFAKIFGDFLGEGNALRVLYLPDMTYHVEFMLHNFSGLVHLRFLCLGFLCLGTNEWQMHLPLGILKFYHLRVLDLKSWHGSCDFPEDMSNLAKLCHYYTPSDEDLHSHIYNVGKLKLLEELKQLEHLTKLRELGIYNLEKVHTKDEAAQAKLIEKNYLRKLTLDWDSDRSTVEPGVEAMVLENLRPHGDLQMLCIRGHGGPSCPTWLGDELAVDALQSLSLYCVSWGVFPSLGKAWDLRQLRLEHIDKPKEFTIEKSFCMLIKLELIGLGSFDNWVYPAEQESSVSGDLLPPDAHMFPLLQVLIIRECPELLGLPFLEHIVSPDWFPKLQELEVCDCPEFLPVIPISWMESLCFVKMKCIKMLKELAYSKSSNGAELEIIGEGDLHSIDQVLVFDKETSLGKLKLERCPPLELKHLLMLTSLKTFIVRKSNGLVGPLGGQGDVEWQLPVEIITMWELNGNNEIRAAEEEEDEGVLLFPAHLFDSLQELVICESQELVLVFLLACGRLKELQVIGSHRFFAGWVPNPWREPVSSTLQELCTDDARGLLSAPICSFLSSSLTKLELGGIGSEGMKRFSKKQEAALQLLSSLQQLKFLCFHSLQQLPAGLHKLTSLDKLLLRFCPAVSSLPNDGLPDDLVELDVSRCCNAELKEQCRGLEETILYVKID